MRGLSKRWHFMVAFRFCSAAQIIEPPPGSINVANKKNANYVLNHEMEKHAATEM